MGASEYTNKLHLPIFRDDDKPSWRGDVNEANAAIDAGFSRLDTDVSTASNLAATAMADARAAVAAQAAVTEVANQARETATAAQQTIDSMESRVSTAENTANRAITIAQGAKAGFSTAAITHGLAYEGYEIIEIRGSDPVPFTKFYAGGHADGIVPRRDLETIKQASARTGYQNIISGDSFTGQDGTSWSTAATLAPVGLQITDSIAVQNFGVHAGERSGSDNAALLVYDSGATAIAYASDNKTAAEYVAEGVVHSFGYGPPLYRNGLAVPFDSTTYAGFSGVTGQSAIARTQTGWVFVVATGTSNTSGMSVANVQSILADYHPIDAILLDTGGAPQAMWQGEFIHPSSDDSGERPIHSFIAITAPANNVFRTGRIEIPVNSAVREGIYGRPPVYIEQVGSLVTLQVNFIANNVTRSWVEFTDGARIPRALWPDSAWELMKGIVSGSEGHPIGIATISNTGSLAMRSQTVSESGYSGCYVVGNISWRAQYA